MGWKSSTDRYGRVAITIHWLTAGLIVALIALGINAEDADSDSLKRALLVPHIALGLLTLALTLFRIAWWAFADKKPADHRGVPKLMTRAATAVHFLIYGFIIALAATGIATNITAGVIEALATGAPIPDLDGVAPREIHGALAWSFMALLSVHIGAALYHHFIRRDGLLARMGLGRLRHRTES